MARVKGGAFKGGRDVRPLCLIMMKITSGVIRIRIEIRISQV